MRRIGLIGLIGLMALPALAAGPFFVWTNGLDSNDGLSAGSAWKTLSKAVSSAGTGSTIYVGAGEYNTNTALYTPLRFTTAGQTFVASNGVVTKQIFIEAANVTLTNFVIGENHLGGDESDPIVWFKSGSAGSKLLGGRVYSFAGHNQYGVKLEGNYGTMSGVDMTGFGPSGICIETASSSNSILNNLVHDNYSPEAVHYVWGNYNLFANNIWIRNLEAELPGSHPDLFQSWGATSWGNVISNNLAINNSCQFGSLQATASGSPYATNAGGWIVVNNVFINQGSKLDVSFRDMLFANNTFYNGVNNSPEGFIINFNDGSNGTATNCVMVNNLFAICGSDPTSTNSGWFSAMAGAVKATLVSSNNMVVGAGFAGKAAASLYGTNWVNGGNPKFLSAPNSRIHVLALRGSTSANQTTNIVAPGASFLTQLAVGDRITLGPFWTDTVAQVTAILNPTNLWVDVPIGRGTGTKNGGAQSMQRSQDFDPLPDLRLLYGSAAINAGANVTAYDVLNVARPAGGYAQSSIGAYEGVTPEVIPANMILHLTFSGWGGGTNVLDSTTNHADAALFRTSTYWPTPGIGPDGGDAAHIGDQQYFGITNVGKLRNLTKGTFAVWASRTNGVGTGYGYIADCGYTYPATNGWTLGNDNTQPTHLYVTDPSNNRLTLLTWPDFGSKAWHHYAFTWDMGTVIAYYDGVPVQTNTLPSNVLTLDDANWLCLGAIQHDTPPGGSTYPNAAYLMGGIADVRAYDTNLTATDVLNVYYVAAAPILPFVPPPAGGLPPQLLMHLNFAGWNGTGNVLDRTANHADGIVFGGNGPTLTNAFGTNAAAHFGTGQYLAVTNVGVLEFLTNGSLTIWINYDNPVGGGDHYAVDGYYGYPDTNGFSVGAPNANPTQFRTWSNSGTYTNISFNDWSVKTNWHHYAITWDGTRTVAYFDGQPFRTNAMVVPFFHVDEVAGWLALGCQHGSHPYDSPSYGWLNGSVADVRLFNYTLPPESVTSVYHFANVSLVTKSYGRGLRGRGLR